MLLPVGKKHYNVQTAAKFGFVLDIIEESNTHPSCFGYLGSFHKLHFHFLAFFDHVYVP
jgi:hypothetical protein